MRGAGKTTAFISFSLQIHLYFCTSHAAHSGKGRSPQASVAHCLCQQSLPDTVLWLHSLCSLSTCHSRQRSQRCCFAVLTLICTLTASPPHTVPELGLSGHSHLTAMPCLCPQWPQRSTICVLLISQTQILPHGKSHSSSLQKQSTGFKQWWLPLNFRFQIKAQKGRLAKESTKGLLVTFK